MWSSLCAYAQSMRITHASLGLTRALRRFKTTRKPTPPSKSPSKPAPSLETKYTQPESSSEENGIGDEMVRYKPLVPLTRPRELLLACTPMRSNVNLSSIARNSGCAGIEKVFSTHHKAVSAYSNTVDDSHWAGW